MCLSVCLSLTLFCLLVFMSMHTQPHRGFSAVSNVAVGHFWEEDRKLVFWQSMELLLFNSFDFLTICKVRAMYLCENDW